MKSNLSITAPLSLPPLGSATTRILLPGPILSSHKKNFAIKASSSSTNPPNPFLPHLKAAACAVIFSAATFWKLPAPALASESLTLTICSAEDSLPLKSSSDALKALLEEKLDDCDSVLWKLAAAEPENEECRCMAARMLTEMGRFEEVLSRALVADRSGEREAVFPQLSYAMEVAEREMAEKEMKLKEARDMRMIMAQMKFLADMQKEMEEAMRSYELMAMEDPAMLYRLMRNHREAEELFAKYKKLHAKQSYMWTAPFYRDY